MLKCVKKKKSYFVSLYSKDLVREGVINIQRGAGPLL